MRRMTMPVATVRPSEPLAEELKTPQLGAREPARQMDLPAHRATHIVNGTRAITGEPALRLAKKKLAKPSRLCLNRAGASLFTPEGPRHQ